MTNIARREVLRHLFVLPVGAAVTAGLVACSRKPQCDDIVGLTPEEATLRKDAAGYLEKAEDPAKPCNKCMQFVAASPDACGTCKVVKGPINPEGGCKLFAAKPG